MTKRKRTPFRDLLEENNISFADFYESCLSVPTEDIGALYETDMAVLSRLEKIIAHLNQMSGKSYTVDDFHLAKLYE